MNQEQTEARVALVTGASRGIGAAIAQVLADTGFIVIGTATTENGANAISERFQSLGIKGRGLVLDVNETESIEQLMTTITSDFTAPSVLVNNAGVTQDQLLMRMKEEDWDSVINTNLRSVYRLSKACLRGMMKARYGRIINISSVVALAGNPGQTNYSAAKAGMIGFSKSLAREVGSRGITVNVIAPGYIETDMTAELTEEQRQALIQDLPVPRLGQSDDIAHAVALLASERAGYITGQTLSVNGGMYM